MSIFISNFKILKEEFEKVGRRFYQSRQVSKNPNKLNEYRQDLEKTYNAIITYVNSCRLDAVESDYANKQLPTLKTKLQLYYDKLSIDIQAPENFNVLIKIPLLQVDSTLDYDSDTGDDQSENSGSNTDLQGVPNIATSNTNLQGIPNITTQGSSSNTEVQGIPLPHTENKLVQGVPSQHTESELQGQNNVETETLGIEMAVMDKIEFLRFASQTIHNNYSGDPLLLETFLNAIALVQECMDAAAHTEIFKKFLLTKIDGKALELLPRNVESIQQIKDALKSKIKPINSKVIEGRMLSLKANPNSMPDYTKQAEDLAEALQRSLVFEGIPQAKAQEMAIERTIEMCRSNARTDLVKSILAATHFSDPKEVVAKFIVETATEVKEKQIFAFNSNRNQSNFRKNFRKNSNFSYQHTQRNGFNNRNRFNNQNNYRGNGNRRNFRNNNYRNNGNYRNNNNYRNNGNQNNNNGRNVRVLESENSNNPQVMTLGGQFENWRNPTQN